MPTNLALRVARVAPPVVLAIVLVSAACTPAAGEVATVSIPGGDRELTAGTTATLTATVETIGGADDAVTWSSSDHAVATIDADGTVTAHASGTADITATSTADPTRSATITLTVREPSAVTGVTIDQGDAELRVDASLVLTATVATTGDADDAVSWSSSEPGVATVDAGGEVTAHDVGTAEITAASVSDPTRHDTVVVTVIPPPGTVAWTRQFGSTDSTVATGVAVDAGAIYVVGRTKGTIEGAASGDGEAFIRSYDLGGEHRWTRQFGADAISSVTGVATDAAGRVYVVGSTTGALDGVEAETRDAFVRAYDADGQVLWTRQFGALRGDRAHGVATDPSGHVYVVGSTGGDEFGYIYDDAFLRSYDANGDHRWTREFGTSDEDVAMGVAADADGHVYVTGHTLPMADATIVGDADVFLRSYDADGHLRWDLDIGTPEHDHAQAIAVARSGHVYVAGDTVGALEGANLGEQDVFVASFDAQGEPRWTRQFGTSGRDSAGGIAVGPGGTVYVVGGVFVPVEGYRIGHQDSFLRAYRADGTLDWARQFGTDEHDVAHAVAVDHVGAAVVVGQVSGALAGESFGRTDGYVKKYGP
jgi:hypothetical protein